MEPLLEKIRIKLLKKKINISKLATLLSLPRSTVYNVLNAKSKRYDILLKAAKYLDISGQELLEEVNLDPSAVPTSESFEQKCRQYAYEIVEKQDLIISSKMIDRILDAINKNREFIQDAELKSVVKGMIIFMKETINEPA